MNRLWTTWQLRQWMERISMMLGNMDCRYVTPTSFPTSFPTPITPSLLPLLSATIPPSLPPSLPMCHHLSPRKLRRVWYSSNYLPSSTYTWWGSSMTQPWTPTPRSTTGQSTPKSNVCMSHRVWLYALSFLWGSRVTLSHFSSLCSINYSFYLCLLNF